MGTRRKIAMDTIRLIQIGVIHSPYKSAGDAPFQGRHRNDDSTIEVFEAYEPALLHIEHCSHLIVLYWADRANRKTLQTRTPWVPKFMESLQPVRATALIR